MERESDEQEGKKEVEDFYAPWRLTRKKPLYVFSVNIDAINAKHGYSACERFLSEFTALMIIDESTRIKNAKAARTKKAKKLGKMARARRILSGTPMPKSPVDLFAQFDFLKEGLIGHKSLTAFTSEFAVLLSEDDPEMQAILRQLAGRVHGIPQVVKKDSLGRPMFKNLSKLSALIEPHSFRALKKDCLDLPSKIYKQVFFELSSAQRAIYSKLELDYEYEHEDSDMGIEESLSFAAIAARTKMKQVTSGFINVYGDAVLMDPKDNPRMEAFKDIVESIENMGDDEGRDKQFIVWAMYDQEITNICELLAEKGIDFRQYTGSTSQPERRLPSMISRQGNTSVS